LEEGKENLNKNTSTFETCISLLAKQNHSDFFRRNLQNEWNLRPLKGTARLALMMAGMME
jgi:hypothetical protein